MGLGNDWGIRAVSGKWLALIIVLCLTLASTLFPILLKLPHHIEIEIVLGAWWAVWWIALGVLLYKGWTIKDDFAFSEKRSFFSKYIIRHITRVSSGEGVGGMIANLILSLLVAVFAFLLVDILVPLIAIFAYLTVTKMLKTVAHDDHGCQGEAVQSVFHAGKWSFVYTLPIVLLVFLYLRFSS